MAVHHASIWPHLSDVHQASVWFNGVYISSTHVTIWLNVVHQASLWHNTIWLTAVQASIYGPMLYIRHHSVAQICASCINMVRCGASMTQAVHHASIWLNTAQLITPYHTLSTSFFATLFVVNT